MNLRKLVVVAAVCALSSPMAWAQDGNQEGGPGVLGYFDPATGAFRPVAQGEDFDLMTAAAVSGGNFLVTFNITVKSAIAATTPIHCSVSATVVDASPGGVNVITESATVSATRTGATARCTVNLPYSWVLQSPVGTQVSLTSVLSSTKPGAAPTGLLSRLHTSTFARSAVPANGVTTKYTVNAVL